MPSVPSPLFVPDWYNFARNADESARPGDWDGLEYLFAFFPGGDKLFEFSGHGRDGTLTDMDPATDWTVGEMGYQLDFAVAAPNDYIDFPITTIDNAHGSIVLTFNYVTFNTTMLGRSTSTQNILRASTSTNINLRGDTGGTQHNFTIPTIAEGEWHRLVVTMDQNDYRVYLDGLESTTGAISTASGHNFTIDNIGRFNGGSTIAYAGSFAETMRFYDRPLSAVEIQEIYNDPWGILRPKRRIFGFDQAVAAAARRRVGVGGGGRAMVM